MAHPSPEQGNPHHSLPIVAEATIDYANEKTLGSVDEIYRSLFEYNEHFALWLRRKVIELYPDDLTARAVTYNFALQAISMLERQGDIDTLQEVFSRVSPVTNETPGSSGGDEALPPAA